jgi:hypothetical protein
MKCQFFPLVVLFASVSFCAVLLFVPSASLAANNGLDAIGKHELAIGVRKLIEV